ncbi:MAG: hypothetical protein K9N07_03870 [Candidatus Cloacimonetes bacterium]|nr:hypothetical protein [Candidatus Cloacimonadota bacterium]
MNNIYSIIDVGTNKISLLTAEAGKDAQIFQHISKVSALGKDMENGLLQNKMIERTIRILEKFIQKAKVHSDDIIVIGTSSSRDAKNISLLSSWLNNKYQIKYNILSGESEVKFIAAANVEEFKEFSNLLMFDIGGGSTEFVWIIDHKITHTQSIDLGIRRLQNKFQYNSVKKRELIRHLLTFLPLKLIEAPTVVGIGGVAVSLSLLKSQFEKSSSSKIHKAEISTKTLLAIHKEISTGNEKMLTSIMPFEADRSELIETGMMIVLEILDYFRGKSFFVSERGIEFGILAQTQSELKKMLIQG